MGLTTEGFDALVVDQEDRPVVLVQVKGHPIEVDWGRSIPQRLVAFGHSVPFLLLVDPRHIQLFRREGDDLVGPIIRLNTETVFQRYDPEFGKRRVFEHYLLTLVEAWLRDLAYHWNSETPPGSEEFRDAGLLTKLEGGMTSSLGG